MIQLNPSIAMSTPTAEGFVHALLDDGPGSGFYRVVLITHTDKRGTCAKKRHVGASKKITRRRMHSALPPAPGGRERIRARPRSVQTSGIA